MTQISDDRLMEIKARGNQFVDKSRGSYGIPAIEMEQIIDELLSARQTIADKDKLIERLVKNSRVLASYAGDYQATIDDSDEHNFGFDVAMKRVLDENKGAWKALGGEEGKG